jgi:hypothetical protein
MPELTWTMALAWFGVLTGAASVAGLIVAVVGNRTVKAMHATTQETLKAMHTTTEESMRQLGTGITTMDTGLKQVLDRMDARAEARYRDLKDRLDGEEEVPPA